MKKFKISTKTNIIIIIFSFALALLLYYPINIILDSVLEFSYLSYPTKYILLNLYIYIIVLTIPVSLIHEQIHGLFYFIFGGKVRFGFKFIYAYTMEVSGIELSRNKFLIVLLMPLVLISLGILLLIKVNFFICAICFLINLFGSCGDLYMAFSLISEHYNVKIVDRPYGYDIIE